MQFRSIPSGLDQSCKRIGWAQGHCRRDSRPGHCTQTARAGISARSGPSRPAAERRTPSGSGWRHANHYPGCGGDELTVIDREGRQPCELVVFDGVGRSDPAIIGAGGAGAPLGTQEILDSRAPSALRVRDALAARGCNFGRADAVRLFGGESRAGESASFVATAPATVVASAPGGPMPVDEQCAPTEIVLYVRRERRPT